ncbi:MAG: hypothetical protein A2750_00620 [Candidatus Yanofskybacteria bacterium RIFCSPHIGHO2_01_FULL_45_42]|uniref:HAD family hydrolase n=3 Tax=Candidatus Yanofskyibacteriota TaxID=1752733 RepID=A0A1F8F7T3_9BACT|nr:MAG: hypothetical protein A2750_00620 [Candidatus Yanofskybacteria bacterium RIFCSPHIGHO2_01_FULL_45_42]OGN16377.1 MAG: hypothetical protein A3C81_02870 [Candidatus Yanofskybacteria bacterium RIFCSPHIGHO2_02_FULL_46_19]OGN26842.1 MAG: hypothetical protein A3B17_00385 [Candidatus Yanofskybacteria bacterium RIFCSPLOWO2_01_FULL_45_72]OGN32372.1 MAG: hypothetical protein A3J01_00410 [Candidatus Yanofskybacteria bacterium RIFCSPLOWO2_02_FULL_45_18]
MIKIFDKELKLLILDVDGVMLDLVANFQTNLEVVASQMDLPLEPLRRFLNDTRSGLHKGSPRFGDIIRNVWSANEEKVREFRQKFGLREYHFPYPPIAGSLETIKWFRTEKVLVAICTNNSLSSLALRFDAAKIDPSLFVICCTPHFIYYKPDIRILHQLFSTVPDIPRDNMLFVGDWWPDMEVARKTGIDFVAVTSGGLPRETFAKDGIPEDHILSKLSDLKNITTKIL